MIPAPAPRLRRRIGLVGLTLYGLGTTIGAGVFALIGKVTGHAGPLAPLAFLVAAGVAALVALTYAELAQRLPKAGGDVAYVHAAWGRVSLSRCVGLAMVMAGVVSSATIVRAAAGYVGLILPVPLAPAVAILLLTVTGFAAWGIAQSVAVAALLSVIEIGALVVVIGFGASSLALGSVPPPAPAALAPVGVAGVMAAAFLAFYAFLGFEDVVTVAEEVRAPERTLPLAIGAMLLISTTLYIGLAVVAVRVVDPSTLAASEAPMALLFAANAIGGEHVIALLTAVSLLNGVLVQIVKSARVIFGMADEGLLPPWIGRVSGLTNTPLRATVLVAAVILFLALAFPLENLAATASALTLALFALVGMALVRLKRHGPPGGGLQLPLVVPVAAAAVSILFLVFGLAGLLID